MLTGTCGSARTTVDRKSTRLNSSHTVISYAVFCLSVHDCVLHSFPTRRSSDLRSPVLSVAQTPDGSVWLGTRGAGLFRVRQGQISSVAEGLPDPKVNCLLADVNGNLWVGTDNGIVRWNGTRLVAAGIPAFFKHLQVLTLVRDRDRKSVV